MECLIRQASPIPRFLLLFFFPLTLLAQIPPTGEQTIEFKVAAGTADTVLKQIAQQSNRPILFALEHARAEMANGLEGHYTVREALEKALLGTRLQAEVLGSGAIAVSMTDLSFATERSQPSEVSSTARPSDTAVSTESSGPLLEKVVVTGSLIRRPERSSQLVTNISNEEIQLMGVTNAVGILEIVPQNIGTERTSTTTATNGGLANFANLRALGSENTLTLINGKRVVKSPLKNNAVDYNMMPMAMLESVDVLSDGASSIYGSDAVAGVINFRLKEEIEGFHYSAHTQHPVAHGGEATAVALSTGLGSLQSDGWNVSLGGTWRNREPILTLDRSFSNSSLLPEHGINNLLSEAFPSNISQIAPDGTVIVNNANPFPECIPPTSLPFRGACGTDADASGFLQLQTPERQASFLGKFSREISSNLKISLEYLWAESIISSTLSPTTFIALAVPAFSPYYPGAGLVPAVEGLNPSQPISIASRWTPGGQRTTENSTVTDRVLAQLMGDFLSADYELWLMRSTTNAELRMLDGAYLRAPFDAGFSGVDGLFLNPFGEQTPEAQAYLDGIRVTEPLINADATLSMAGLVLSRDFSALAAGPISAVLALEFDEEKVDYSRNPVADRTRGAVVGGDQSAYLARSRYSLTGEFLIPLTSRLEVSASARFDQYSDFGRTTNPKLMMSYDVTDRLNLRGSVNTGFRAPTLYNISTPNTLSIIVGTVYDDPVLCPGGVANDAAGGVDIRDCAQRYQTLLGGNEDLDPEESIAYSTGLGLQALGAWRVTLDYWRYSLDGKIGPLPHTSIFDNPDRFSDYLIRCSNADPGLALELRTCAFGGGGDPIAYVVQTNLNLGETNSSGVDLSANWSGRWLTGDVAFNYRATYVSRFDFEPIPGDPPLSRAGRYVAGYPVPRYTHFLTFDWSVQDWSAQLQNRFVSGYRDCNAACGITEEYFNDVSSHSLWSAALSYHLSEHLLVTGHIANLFNTSPPFSNGGLLCTGCDNRFADPTGLSFGLTVRGHLN